MKKFKCQLCGGTFEAEHRALAAGHNDPRFPAGPDRKRPKKCRAGPKELVEVTEK